MTCYEHVRTDAEACGGRYVAAESVRDGRHRVGADVAGASGVLSRRVRVPAAGRHRVTRPAAAKPLTAASWQSPAFRALRAAR